MSKIVEAINDSDFDRDFRMELLSLATNIGDIGTQEEEFNPNLDLRLYPYTVNVDEGGITLSEDVLSDNYDSLEEAAAIIGGENEADFMDDDNGEWFDLHADRMFNDGEWTEEQYKIVKKGIADWKEDRDYKKLYDCVKFEVVENFLNQSMAYEINRMERRSHIKNIIKDLSEEEIKKLVYETRESDMKDQEEHRKLWWSHRAQFLAMLDYGFVKGIIDRESYDRLVDTLSLSIDFSEAHSMSKVGRTGQGQGILYLKDIIGKDYLDTLRHKLTYELSIPADLCDINENSSRALGRMMENKLKERENWTKDWDSRMTFHRRKSFKPSMKSKPKIIQKIAKRHIFRKNISG